MDSIIQISRHEKEGGVARIAGYLHEAYRKRGLQSIRMVSRKKSADPYVWKIPDDLLWFLGSWPQRIIHLHGPTLRWPFDLKTLPELSEKAPVIVHMHDAELLGGGCTHSLGCQGWLVGCEDAMCPSFRVQRMGLSHESAANNWKAKCEIFSQSRLYVVAPCHWLMNKARRSILSPAIVEGRIIPHGVDSAVFHPADKRRMRAELGLPVDSTVILLVNQGSWRNYNLAIQTMHQLYPKTASDVLILCVGKGLRAENVSENRLLMVDHQSPERIAAYYQASDIYLHPAAGDTFPNMVLEALACGLPVVATNVGGIPEQIRDGVTGFLVSPMSRDAMANRAELLLENDALRHRMSVAAAEDARTRFGVERMVDNFVEWYGLMAGDC